MRILIVEDEPKTGEYLRQGLTEAGYIADLVPNGSDGLHMALQGEYSLVILDVMLPGLNGWQVLQALRDRGLHMPVLFLTARDHVEDRVKGLELGADDYLVKPFAFEELLARIHCVARRPRTLENTRSISFLDLTFYPEEYRLSGPSGSCTLSRREAALMETFLRRKEQPLSRSSLLLTVWGPDSDVEEGNLDNYIHFLRRRLTTVGSSLSIKTLRGFGYCLKEK